VQAFLHWDDYLGLKNAKCRVSQTGVLWLMQESPGRIRSEVDRLKALDIHTAALDLNEYADLFPSLSPCQNELDLTASTEHHCSDFQSFLWEPDGGYADPVAANEDFLAAARLGGASIQYDTKVTGLRQGNGEIGGVHTAKGETIHTPIVVNAAGPWCNDLITVSGIDFRWNLEPTRIQCCVRDTPQGFKGRLPVFCDAAGGLYGRAEAGGAQILFGSILPRDEEERVSDPDDFNTSVDPDYRDEKLHAIHHRIQGCAGRGNAGGFAALYMVNTDDMHPIVDETDLKGFYLANGFSGHGFKLAPVVGMLIAQNIFNQTQSGHPGLDSKLFSIDRTRIHLKIKNVLA